MSKKHKRKKKPNPRDSNFRTVADIDKDILLYRNRYIELCEQYNSATNNHTKHTLKCQLSHISDEINMLMTEKNDLPF